MRATEGSRAAIWTVHLRMSDFSGFARTRRALAERYASRVDYNWLTPKAIAEPAGLTHVGRHEVEILIDLDRSGLTIG